MRRVIVLTCLLIGVLFSCEEPPTEDITKVVTEDIVYVSGETIIITGRLISPSLRAAIDHGFELSNDEGFSNPTRISLGEKSVPGRFVAEYKDLSIDSDYFIRSYVDFSDESFLGNILSFSSLNPGLVDFQPRSAFGNQRLKIEGVNLTADTKVFFDGEEVEINSLKFESIIEIDIPSFNNKQFAEIVLVSQGDTLTFPYPFEYVIGKWEPVANFPTADNYYDALFFKYENDLIFGLGTLNFSIYAQNEIYKMDLDNFEWTNLNYFGPSMAGAYRAGPHFGGGSLEKDRVNTIPLPVVDNFFNYNGTDFDQLFPIPHQIYNAAVLTDDNYTYLYGGETIDRIEIQTAKRYDPVTEIWDEPFTFPYPISFDTPSFSHGGYNYFLLKNGDLLRHDPEINFWVELQSFPEADKIAVDGISVVVGDDVYIGVFESNKKLWEYSIEEDVWKPKVSFPGTFLETNVAYWSHNDKVYLIRTRLEESAGMQVWQFSPNEF